MKNFAIFVLFSISVSFFSCASADAIMLSQKRYPPLASPELVQIFLDEKDLPPNFEKVALIKSEVVSGYDKAQWKKIKARCAQIGANGVWLKTTTEAKNGEKIAAAVFGTLTTDKAELVAIYFQK